MTWAAAAVTMLASVVCLFAIAGRHPGNDALSNGEGDSAASNFLGSLAFVGTLLLQRSHPMKSGPLSLMLLFVTSSGFSYIVFYSYSAVLTSSMISRYCTASIKLPLSLLFSLLLLHLLQLPLLLLLLLFL